MSEEQAAEVVEKELIASEVLENWKNKAENSVLDIALDSAQILA